MTDWIVTSSVLILVVAALRYLLRGKISLRLQYALWAIVLLRLLLPVQLGQTPFSVLNAVTEREELRITVTEPFFYIGETPDLAPPVVEDDTLTEAERTAQERQLYLEYLEEMARYATPVSLSTVLYGIWLVGAAGTAAVFFVSNLRFARRLRRSSRTTELHCGTLPVYVSPLVETPCLFGLLRPAVYVTEDVLADHTALGHVLLHEETHYRHGDHLWAALRGLCLALHWYNPLVWLAASLSRRDSELACDEGTLQRLGEGERTAYGETLIALTCGRCRPLLAATTMTDSKGSLRERITLIARRPKMAASALLAAVLVMAAAAGCTFTGGKAAEDFTFAYADDISAEANLRSAVQTYLLAHANILNEAAGDSDFISGAMVTSLQPGTDRGSESGFCMYEVAYWFHCEDQHRLPELSKNIYSSGKWQEEGTNGNAPELMDAYNMGDDPDQLVYGFRGEVLAPYSEPGVDEGRGTIPVTYKDSWQLPDAVIDSAAEFVEERADAIQMLVAAPDFITEGEITCLEPVDTASVSETLHIRLYYLDYRLRLRIPDAVNMSLDGMIYQEDDGSVWLVEPDTGSTRVLVMEYWVEEGRWSRVGLLDTRQIAEEYGDDYSRAAVEFYESVRNKG